jgi:tRNA (pseudouridine54-N1)-methyltransferase
VVSPVPFHDELLGDEFADPSRVEREVVELERLVGVEDGLEGGFEVRSLVEGLPDLASGDHIVGLRGPADKPTALVVGPHAGGMREFVVLGHEAPTDPDFPLDALPSEAGRLDVLCRCVTAAFLLSHGIREDVRVHLVLQDDVTARFEGAELRRLNPDERSTAALVRTALEAKADAIGHQEADPASGVYLGRFGFETVLDRVDGPLVQLHEEGTPLVVTDAPSDPTFVLSDHRDFTDEEADLLDGVADERLRLGPERLHADHAVSVVHNWLDTDGYSRY